MTDDRIAYQMATWLVSYLSKLEINDAGRCIDILRGYAPYSLSQIAEHIDKAREMALAGECDWKRADLHPDCPIKGYQRYLVGCCVSDRGLIVAPPFLDGDVTPADLKMTAEIIRRLQEADNLYSGWLKRGYHAYNGLRHVSIRNCLNAETWVLERQTQSLLRKGEAA